MEDKKTPWYKNIFKRAVAKVETPKADFSTMTGNYRNLFSVSYDGEKNLGEAGPIKNYIPDYNGLRFRSWAAYLDSDLAQTVFNRFTTWVIGSGLKLQAEPNQDILESEGITLDRQKFSKQVESRFQVFRKSKLSDYAGMKNLNLLSKAAFKTSIVGGDVLVYLRYVEGRVSVQLIDGCHVQSPVYGSELYAAKLENGNVVKHGIEFNDKGEHVAYYICNGGLKYSRIPAKSDTGLQMAFLVYGLEYRLDNVRGMPLITAIIESIKKLERYKEATIGSAEETAKIAYQVVHQQYSTGESPLVGQLAKAFDAGASTDNDLPKDDEGKELANLVAATTNKQAYNNPVGAEIKTIESKKELYFKDFYSVNIDLVCAALGIPPNVALSKYTDSFSASRAAIKDWEHTLKVERERFSFQFMQPIYDFWLEIKILENKILAPGYLPAKFAGNTEVLEAYRNARFIGAAVPHIDPVKEVQAARLKLGALGAHLPLTTLEAVTEDLGNGESSHNLEQFGVELDTAKKQGMEPVPVGPAVKEKEEEEEKD